MCQPHTQHGFYRFIPPVEPRCQRSKSGQEQKKIPPRRHKFPAEPPKSPSGEKPPRPAATTTPGLRGNTPESRGGGKSQKAALSASRLSRSLPRRHRAVGPQRSGRGARTLRDSAGLCVGKTPSSARAERQALTAAAALGSDGSSRNQTNFQAGSGRSNSSPDSLIPHRTPHSLRCAFVSNFPKCKSLLSFSSSSAFPPSPLPPPPPGSLIPNFPPKWRLAELEM